MHITADATGRQRRRAHRMATLAVVAALVGTTAQPGLVPARAGAAERLVPALSLSVSSGPVGRHVVVMGTGFTVGAANVLWDGALRDSFTISAGNGSFSVGLQIPQAPAGPHTITVCASIYPLGSPCNTGEFEEEATATFTVTTDPPPFLAGAVDYQILALEVTQGVRGDVPTRVAPAGSTTLDVDDAVHVANRPTVVRAYPWISANAGGRAVGAYLQVQLPDGRWSDRIFPVTRRVSPIVDRSVADMRQDAQRSFNFVLPQAYTEPGSRAIRVAINPVGLDHQPETPAQANNNTVTLPGVRFATVQGRDRIQMHIYIADLAYRDAAGTIVKFMPDRAEISRSLNAWIKTWPIDPASLLISYRYTQISQNPPQDEGPEYDGLHPREVSPPIPGYPQWNNQVYLDESLSILRRHAWQPGSGFIWLALDTAWDQCRGRYEGLGPFFWATATTPSLVGCDNPMRHEAGHAMSLLHAGNAHGEAAGGGYNPAYPGLHGEVEPHAYGFDVWTMQAIPPTTAAGHTHDFMSYGPPVWVSIYTWENLARIFGASEINVGHFAPGPSVSVSSATAVATEQLRISGHIADGDEVYLDPAFTVTPAADEGPAEPARSGEYLLTLRDAAGRMLAERAFTPRAAVDPTVRPFYELLPMVDGIARLEVSRGGRVIGVKTVSPQPAAVRLVSPAAGARWAAAGRALVSWAATDYGGDPLTFRVQVSPDGQDWRTIAGPGAQTQASIPLDRVPGAGPGWRLRVQASDGLNVVNTEVGDLTIAAKSPIPTILTPVDRAFVGTGGSMDLLGQAYDFQDEHLPATSLRWLLDGRPIATGGSASTGPLSAGEHTLTLRATNSAGVPGTTQITIVAGRDADGDGLPDEWERRYGLSPADPGDATEDADGDGVLNRQEYEVATDPRDPTQPAPPRPELARSAEPAGERLTVPAAPSRSTAPFLVAGVLAVLVILAGLGWLLVPAAAWVSVVLTVRAGSAVRSAVPARARRRERWWRV